MAETLYGLEKELRDITAHDQEWIASRKATLDILSSRAIAAGLDRQIAVAETLEVRLGFELKQREEAVKGPTTQPTIEESEWNSFVSFHSVDAAHD